MSAPLEEQGLGSLTTHFSGTVNAEVASGSIQFAGGSRVVAMDSGSWSPAPDGSPGSAPANYGGEASDYFSRGVAAIRQVELDMTSGVLPVANGGFDVRTVTFTIPAGVSSSLAYRVEGAIRLAGSLAMSGHSAAGMSTTGTLTTVGNQQILTIPVNYTATWSIASDKDSQIVLTGQLVATRTLLPPTPRLHGAKPFERRLPTGLARKSF